MPSTPLPILQEIASRFSMAGTGSSVPRRAIVPRPTLRGSRSQGEAESIAWVIRPLRGDLVVTHRSSSMPASRCRNLHPITMITENTDASLLWQDNLGKLGKVERVESGKKPDDGEYRDRRERRFLVRGGRHRPNKLMIFRRTDIQDC